MLTTIVVTKQTRERIRDLGKKGETYEHILRRILDQITPADENEQ